MKIIAHRAGTDRYPEQSQASIRHSFSMGADYVEVDIRFTKDHVPVICHDANVQHVFGQDVNVQELRLDEFLCLRYTADHSMSAYSLKQLFAEDPGPLLLHIKEYALLELDTILSLIREYHNEEAIVLGVAAPEAIGQIRSFDKRIATLSFMKTEQSLDTFLASDVQIIRLWESWVTQEKINLIHGASKRCWVMSGVQKRPGFTDPSNLAHWRSMGVDGILINEIEPLAEWMRGL
jgi:glycerophosphoryl diester phosphodiesterase